MDIRKVKKLIELLEESGISEIEISEGEESVRISRYPKPGTVTTTVAPAAPVAASPAPAAAAAAAVPAEPAAPPIRGQQVTARLHAAVHLLDGPGGHAHPPRPRTGHPPLGHEPGHHEALRCAARRRPHDYPGDPRTGHRLARASGDPSSGRQRRERRDHQALARITEGLKNQPRSPGVHRGTAFAHSPRHLRSSCLCGGS